MPTLARLDRLMRIPALIPLIAIAIATLAQIIPARHPHWAQARGATVLQVSGNGPFQPSLGVPK